MQTRSIATPTDWQHLQPHPLAEIVEFGAGIDLDALAAHMRQYGYDPDEAIVLHDGMILDGRHRLRAAIQAGVTPTFKVFEGRNAIAYVGKKMHRQHLDTSQRALLAATLAEHVPLAGAGIHPIRPAAAPAAAHGHSSDDERSLLNEVMATSHLCAASLQRTLAYAKASGEALLQAKALRTWGTWDDWLEACTPFSQRLARSYLRLARDWDKLMDAGGLPQILRAFTEDSAEEGPAKGDVEVRAGHCHPGAHSACPPSQPDRPGDSPGQESAEPAEPLLEQDGPLLPEGVWIDHDKALALEAMALHDFCEIHGQRALQFACKAGKALCQLGQQVGEDRWEAYVRTYLPGSVPTARTYCLVWQERRRIMRSGSLRSALAVLVEEPPPEQHHDSTAVLLPAATPAPTGAGEPERLPPRPGGAYKDPSGCPIPEHLVEAWLDAQVCGRMAQQVKDVHDDILAQLDRSGFRGLEALRCIHEQLTQVHQSLLANCTIYVCPDCKGQPKEEGCHVCKGAGLVLHYVWGMAPWLTKAPQMG
jgi:hypothetical protein